MKYINILVRDNEFANENTDIETNCEYDRRFLLSSEEFTEEKRNELKELERLYYEYEEWDGEDDTYKEEWNNVADVSLYNLYFDFFSKFTNYYDELPVKVFIG